MEKKPEKPDCDECKYQGTVPGSRHSSCKHPKANLKGASPFEQAMAIFASVGRVSPQIKNTAVELGIKGSAHGIKHGWFNWPYNFDPVWLESCNGFERKGV